MLTNHYQNKQQIKKNILMKYCHLAQTRASTPSKRVPLTNFFAAAIKNYPTYLEDEFYTISYLNNQKILDFNDLDCSGLNLTGCDLSNMSLERADLTGCNLSGVILKNTLLNSCTMTNVTKLSARALSDACFQNIFVARTDIQNKKVIQNAITIQTLQARKKELIKTNAILQAEIHDSKVRVNMDVLKCLLFIVSIKKIEKENKLQIPAEIIRMICTLISGFQSNSKAESNFLNNVFTFYTQKLAPFIENRLAAEDKKNISQKIT